MGIRGMGRWVAFVRAALVPGAVLLALVPAHGADPAGADRGSPMAHGQATPPMSSAAPPAAAPTVGAHGADAGLAHRIAMAAFLAAPYPPIDDALTPAEAYAVQALVIADGRKRSPVAGFKAGLTDPAARLRFGAREPVSGALLASGRLGNRSNITLDADDQVMIELEIGYVLARPVTAPLADTDDPLPLVAAIVPVVELPNLNLAGPPSVADIVASNVSAQQYVVGDARQVPADDVLEAITARLARDDVQVAAGNARAVLGSQVAALRWLINHRLARGDALETGQLLITGSMTGMTPAAGGRYKALFGPLGSVEFKVFAPR